MKERTADLTFNHVSGREFPFDLTDYDLVLHCGGCMLNRKEVLSRLEEAHQAGVPVINYGMAIAYLHNILDRALKPFLDIYSDWLAKKE
jgi:predicted GTPase